MGTTLEVGILVYREMDQIDATGPFEVFARVPEANVRLIGVEAAPVADHKGLILTPHVSIASMAERPPLEVLVVPGGRGQEALMEDERVLSFIRDHAAAGRWVLSVCTGALLCGAAGLLRDRRATTHWAAFHLLPIFGAVAVDQRVVVDGKLVSAAGVTAGIDGAFQVVARLRGNEAAAAIELDLVYAPEPLFHAGTPEIAPPELVRAVRARYQAITEARERTAQRLAARLGAAVR
jgi:cyclohexyl-isocyanide hydratase